MRFPSVDSYLGRLPGGLDAYPDCVIKASVLRNTLKLDRFPTAGLPAPLATLIDDPPPVSAWIPEAHFNACVLALYDEWFAEQRDRQFDLWSYERNLDLFRQPLYRILFAVISPERLLLGAQSRWSAFRRGTTLDVLEQSQGAAIARISYPPQLYPVQTIRALAAAIRAALVSAGARSASAHSQVESPRSSLLEMKWLAS